MSLKSILTLDKKILKTITYRILGSLITIIVSLLVGVPFEWASIIGISELVIKPILYFLHESMWESKSVKKIISEEIPKQNNIVENTILSEPTEIKRISYKSNR